MTVVQEVKFAKTMRIVTHFYPKEKAAFAFLG